MEETDAVQALRQSPLAAELSDDQVAKLAGIVAARTLEDQEVLIAEGDDDEMLYAICQGELEVCRPGAQGQMMPLLKLGAGEVVGEIGFLDGLRRTATVRAAGKAKVVGLDRSALEDLVEREPWLVYRVMRAVLRSVHQVVQTMNRDHADLVGYVMR